MSEHFSDIEFGLIMLHNGRENAARKERRLQDRKWRQRQVEREEQNERPRRSKEERFDDDYRQWQESLD